MDRAKLHSFSVARTLSSGDDMAKASKHVVPNPAGGWAVKNSGSVRASKTFDTQQQAVGYGRQVAKKSGTELYIHGRDGTIKDKRSYGNDPMPPRDKK
jgi:hypothetical protein